jgi:hypothetical protein
MTLRSEAILLDGMREALALYQRSLMWAITASLSSILLSPRFRAPSATTVEVLWGHLSLPVAWLLSVLLFFIFSALAVSAIRRARQILVRLAPEKPVLDAIMLFPSLATLSSGFFRIGSVVLPPLALLIGMWLELSWERARSDTDETFWLWFGVLVIVMLVLLPYSIILNAVWHPLRLAVPEGDYPARSAADSAKAQEQDRASEQQ